MGNLIGKLEDGVNVFKDGVSIIKNAENGTVEVIKNGISAYKGTEKDFFESVKHAEDDLTVAGVDISRSIENSYLDTERNITTLGIDLESRAFAVISSFEKNAWGQIDKLRSDLWTTVQITILIVAAFGTGIFLLYSDKTVDLIQSIIKDVIGKFHFN